MTRTATFIDRETVNEKNDNISLFAIGFGRDRLIATFSCHCERESTNKTNIFDNIFSAGVEIYVLLE